METSRPPASLRRIWVVGPCGSGKSTIADRLGMALDLPVTHLDELHWNPGWVETDRAAYRHRVADVTAADAWVIDGNTQLSTLPDASRIDLAVWLDLPFIVTLSRVVARSWRRIRTKERVCNGNVETLRRALSPRDSIVWWSIRTHWWRRRMLTEELGQIPHVRLHTKDAVDSWVSAITSDEPTFMP